LVNDIHDTFGGYIEALRLRLLMNDGTAKINPILEAFQKDC
tara:strand:+ start:12404 stop:12526 length:123 start_codon:yes stop_codon:yes gene_type:complete